jgi:hypothetical protein
MKLALRLSIIVSGIVSAVALAELSRVLLGFFVAGPFLQVINYAEYKDLGRLLQVWAAYSFTAIVITIYLWRTCRRQDRKPRKSY